MLFLYIRFRMLKNIQIKSRASLKTQKIEADEGAKTA